MAQQNLVKKELEINNQESELKTTQLKSSQTILKYVSAVLLVIILVISFRFYEIKKTKDVLRSKNILIEEEKRKSEDLLLNILPFDVAEELKEKGESKARGFDDVTVLFTDFAVFTRCSEQLSAQELVSEVNTCFKEFDETVDRYTIEKIKTIGDAYMAAGGLQNPKTAGPKEVILAAFEMQQFMQKRKMEKQK